MTASTAALAAVVGRFIGGVLVECAPVLIYIIRQSMTPTVEDGKIRNDLREELLAKLPKK